MTEYFRKDSGLMSKEPKLADPDVAEMPAERIPTERMVGSEKESHSSPAPPAIESQSPSATGRTGTGAATARAREAAGDALARAPEQTATRGSSEEERTAALFASNESNELRARWDSIQVGFVDEPRKAVEDADALVSATMKRLSEIFANERQTLEQQWDRRENISTEDFRVALQKYRSFFARLLSV